MKRTISVVLCITFILSGAAVYGNDASAMKYVNEYINLCKTFLTTVQDMTGKMDAARKAQKAADVMALFTNFQKMWTKFQSDFSALQKRYSGIVTDNDEIVSPELEALIDSVVESIAAFQSAFTGED